MNIINEVDQAIGEIKNIIPKVVGIDGIDGVGRNFVPSFYGLFGQQHASFSGCPYNN